jgi:hypothetical protein
VARSVVIVHLDLTVVRGFQMNKTGFEPFSRTIAPFISIPFSSPRCIITTTPMDYERAQQWTGQNGALGQGKVAAPL